MKVIGYTIKIKKPNAATINYEQLHDMLDDFVSMYLAKSSNVTEFTSSIIVSDMEEEKIIARETNKPVVKKPCNASKKEIKKQCKKRY